jgi:hypothetical protein
VEKLRAVPRKYDEEVRIQGTRNRTEVFPSTANNVTVLGIFPASSFKFRSTYTRNGMEGDKFLPLLHVSCLGVDFFFPYGCRQFGLAVTLFNSAMQTDGTALCTHKRNYNCKLRIKIPLGSYSGLSLIPKRAL